MADCVAKLFSRPNRATLIQERTLARSIDSKSVLADSIVVLSQRNKEFCNTIDPEQTQSLEFGYRDLRKFRRGRADYSALMPANLITLVHFSVSSAMNFPKSAGEPANGAPPRSASRALILGCARPALISLLSLWVTSSGESYSATMVLVALDAKANLGKRECPLRVTRRTSSKRAQRVRFPQSRLLKGTAYK